MNPARNMKPARDRWTRYLWTRPPFTRATALIIGGLTLAGCSGVPASLLPPGSSWPEEGKKTDPKAAEAAFPSFGAPPQVGDRPVLDTAGRAKMQTDLEALAKQRESQLLKEIEDDGENAGQ